MNSQDALTHALEERFGLRNVRSEWVRRQTAFSTDTVAGPICRTDICEISEGTLPWNILEAHSVQLDTKVLVQIEDVINIASSDPRSRDAPTVLQLTVTDGCTDFVAIELEPLQRLSLMTVPGTKVILHPSALVRRGRVFLTTKDFTFLGPPSSNIWGDAYDEKVASALGAAGLHNAMASTFDSIARNAVQNGDGVRAFPDMGGIADAVRTTNDEDDNDDGFWAEAAAFADRNEAENASARRESPHQINGNHAEPSITRRAVATNPLPNLVLQSDAAQARLTGINRARKEQQEPIVVDDIRNDGHEVMDIPEMPVFDSDAAAFDSDFETTARNTAGATSGNVATEIDEIDDFRVPELPLSRLVDGVSESRNAGLETSIYRAFVMKPIRKPKAVLHKNGFLLSVPFDDGTAIDNLSVDDALLKRLTGVDFRPRELSGSVTSGSDDSKHTSEVSLQPHKHTRGITGFIQVRHNEEKLVTAVSTEPPGGYVSARFELLLALVQICRILTVMPATHAFHHFISFSRSKLHNLMYTQVSFVAAYADNIEARLAQYLMETAS